MTHCAQLDRGEWGVPSDSNADKVYAVRAFSTVEPPTCTCPAYAIQRNRNGGKLHGAVGTCKHLKFIERTVCHWRQDRNDVTFYDTCPRCGGPLSEDSGELAGAPDRDTAIANMIEMLRENGAA